MENSEFEKGEVFIIDNVACYTPGVIKVNVIMKSHTGNVSIHSFDAGQEYPDKVSAFDELIQVVEGEAELTIAGSSSRLMKGDAVIIPAHAKNRIKADRRFRMISTVIKNGYEEMV